MSNIVIWTIVVYLVNPGSQGSTYAPGYNLWISRRKYINKSMEDIMCQ